MRVNCIKSYNPRLNKDGIMAFEFRLVECVLVFVLILCIFPDNIAKQQAKKKPFQSLKGILPFIKKNERPMYHNRLLDWNLTSQLSAARYMLNMYENINTEDSSPGFNVSNFTSTKQVQGADTIMGILNDGEFCLGTGICLYLLFVSNANKQRF